jgi:hypothetical protein
LAKQLNVNRWDKDNKIKPNEIGKVNLSMFRRHGINFCHPPENKDIFCKISENGAIITQFPFNRPGDKQSFPIRNRIIAGMTLGTVVQAHEDRLDCHHAHG